jgi:2-desacetyl-2-hydroxyethyl bacteriochlorophyllide A dehydrogenase
MQALELQRPGELQCVERPVPSPAPGEVLVRTVATTICTSDLGDIRANPFGIALPRILGHEAAGVVAEVGAGVKSFAVGDRIAAHPVIPCGNCVECGRGLGHLCSRLGHLGVDRGGSFAEFFCIPAGRVRRIPENLDMAQAALLEPVSVCLEAVQQARVRAGETVLIAGDGPFGVMIARLVRRVGADAIMTGRHAYRMQRATGARTVGVDETADPLAEVLRLTDGRGVDAAILAVDSQAALDLCVASLRPRGRLAVFAIMPDRPRIDMLRILVKELELVGACNDQDLLDEALDLIVGDELQLGQLVSHRIRFYNWPEAFRMAGDRPECTLKVALVFPEAQAGAAGRRPD